MLTCVYFLPGIFFYHYFFLPFLFFISLLRIGEEERAKYSGEQGCPHHTHNIQTESEEELLYQYPQSDYKIDTEIGKFMSTLDDIPTLKKHMEVLTQTIEDCHFLNESKTALLFQLLGSEHFHTILGKPQNLQSWSGSTGETIDLFRLLQKNCKEKLRGLGVPLRKYYEDRNLREVLGNIRVRTIIDGEPRQDAKEVGIHARKNIQTSGLDRIPKEESIYIHILRLVALGVNDTYQRVIRKVVKSHGGTHHRAPIKGDVRIRNKALAPEDHLECAFPRPAKNIDVVRNGCVFSQPDAMQAAIEELCGMDCMGGGVGRMKNGYADSDKKAESAYHYRTLMTNFVYHSPFTYGELAQKSQQIWQRYVYGPSENPDINQEEWHDHALKAAEYLSSNSIANNKVNIMCEVQFMLNQYWKVRDKSHTLYKVVRAPTSEHLRKQFIVKERFAVIGDKVLVPKNLDDVGFWSTTKKLGTQSGVVVNITGGWPGAINGFGNPTGDFQDFQPIVLHVKTRNGEVAECSTSAVEFAGSTGKKFHASNFPGNRDPNQLLEHTSIGLHRQGRRNVGNLTAGELQTKILQDYSYLDINKSIQLAESYILDHSLLAVLFKELIDRKHTNNLDNISEDQIASLVSVILDAFVVHAAQLNLAWFALRLLGHLSNTEKAAKIMIVKGCYDWLHRIWMIYPTWDDDTGMGKMIVYTSKAAIANLKKFSK